MTISPTDTLFLLDTVLPLTIDGRDFKLGDVGDSGIIPLPPVDPSVEVDEAARKKVDKAGPGVFFPDPRWHGKSRLSREQETAESDITSNLIECWSSYHSPTLFCLLSQAWDSVPSSQWE